MKRTYENLVLIGMSGAGKSTLGVLLAKALGLQFTDTDLLIQAQTGKFLQEIIDSEGVERFMQIEEDVVSRLSLQGSVIATGGSVVYSERAMAHLKKRALTVYLYVDFEELKGRLSNITTRGIVFKGKNDLCSVYQERLPLYERYADLRIDCTACEIETAVERIVEAVRAEEH